LHAEWCKPILHRILGRRIRYRRDGCAHVHRYGR
jgi:hypothetical protein